jgi:acetylglutamate kinase
VTTPNARRLCLKIGGAQLEHPAARSELARGIANARKAGHAVVLVHGGGNQIRSLAHRLGLVDRYHEGLRITDEATADVALQVLAGEVNKTLVQCLVEHGVPAVGLCGADGGISGRGTFTAERHAPGGVDLGYVGAVHRVDPHLPELLLASGYVPCLATLAPLENDLPGARDRLYNINADHAAAPLASALGCDALLFLTDVPGVLDADRIVIPALDAMSCRALQSAGVLSGGMLPKVDAALRGAAELPDGLVKIAPAAGPDAVLRALRDDVGTRFTNADAPVGHAEPRPLPIPRPTTTELATDGEAKEARAWTNT